MTFVKALAPKLQSRAVLAALLLDDVSGGGLSVIGPNGTLETQYFDDGSSMTVSTLGGNVVTSRIPGFHNVLAQGPIGDCFAIVTINSIAKSPAGRDYLDTLVREVGDEQYEVRMLDPNGQPTTVQVSLDDHVGATASNPEYVALERALGTTRSGDLSFDPMAAMNGGYSADVMRQLGLEDVRELPVRSLATTAPSDRLVNVVGTYGETSERGLIGGHAYSVVGRGHDDIQDRDMVYVSNPHGDEPTLAVPLDEADELFAPVHGVSGQIPRVSPTATSSSSASPVAPTTNRADTSSSSTRDDADDAVADQINAMVGPIAMPPPVTTAQFGATTPAETTRDEGRR